jgi:hypothetical protein
MVLDRKWVDPLKLYNRKREPIDALRGLLAGRSAFLVCGGPSAKQLPLEALNSKGTWSLAVNNSAAHQRYRPQAFVCSDPPSKFSDSIWLDPAIMKILPNPKLIRNRGKLRTKLPPEEWKPCEKCDGTGRTPSNKNKGCKYCSAIGTVMFKPLRVRGYHISADECPNVWGFDRRSWLLPDETFFTEPDAAWGNHNAGVLRTGQPKTVCTMLLGMRLLRYLGAKKVYMVGVDFFMDPMKPLKENYSFEEERDASAVGSNNRQFRVVNQWLCEMQEGGVFKKFDIQFFNCNPNSGLRAFPHVPFDQALADVTKGVDQKPDLCNWYQI